MLFVKKLDPKAHAPSAAHPGEDLGYDLTALEDTLLHPMQTTKIRTGISALYMSDSGDEAQKFGLLIRDRSSMAVKGIFTTGGVVDAGYTGEIIVMLTLVSSTTTYLVRAGDKIAQMIPVPVLTGTGIVDIGDEGELTNSERKQKGFGSTGK